MFCLNRYPRTNFMFHKQCDYFYKQFSWPTEYKCGTFSPISTFAFYFIFSCRVALNVQKISRSTRDLVFGKMKRGMSKEEVERFAQLGRDKQKATIE